MKKLLRTLFAATLVAGVMACAKETPEEIQPSGEIAALQFELKQPAEKFVTRADISTSNEWNIATLDVYAVAPSSGYGSYVAKLTPGTDYTMAQDAATHTFTITMSEAWVKKNAGKGMNFYFVGNDASSATGPHTYLTGIRYYEADFKSVLTNSLAGNPIPKPNGTTRNLLFSTSIQVPNITGTVKYSGMLKRRVARFDIEVNKEHASKFVLTRVAVENTRQTGFIFADGDAASAASSVNAAGFSVPKAELAYNAKTDGATVNNAVQSAFYLYPTAMGKGAAYETKIVVYGTYDGVEKAFPVIVPGNTQIRANFRYIIHIDDPTSNNTEIGLLAIDYAQSEDLDTVYGAGKNPQKATITALAYEGTMENNIMSVGRETAVLSLWIESKYGVIVKAKENVEGTIQIENATQFTRSVNASEVFDVWIMGGNENLEAYVDVISTENPADNVRYTITRNLTPPAPEPPYILYMDDATKALSAGKFDNDKVKVSDMAFFKFGSVIGCYGLNTTWPTNGSAITFNPTKLKWGTDITKYNNGTARETANTLPGIPGFITADVPKTVTVESGYITVANVRAGKGDPCMLVGYTAKQIQDMTDSELQNVLANAKLRLPTRAENETFVGSTSDWASRWTAGGDCRSANPATATFGAYKLPVTGCINLNGSSGADDAFLGIYVLSTLSGGDPGGEYMTFRESRAPGTAYDGYGYSRAVRCVPNTPLYEVKVAAGANGKVSHAGGSYGLNEKFSVTATPNTGYKFTGWTSSTSNITFSSTTAATTTITVKGSGTVTANFGLQSYAVTVKAGTGGSVTGSGTYDYNKSVAITATPNANYKFVNWTSSTSNITFANANSASTTMTVKGTGTVTANFAETNTLTHVSNTVPTTLGNSPAATTVTVNTSLSSWEVKMYVGTSATATQTWTFTTTGSSAKGTFTIPQNASKSSRTVTLKLRNPVTGVETAFITNRSQDGGVFEFVSSTLPSGTIPAAGGTYSFTVKTNLTGTAGSTVYVAGDGIPAGTMITFDNVNGAVAATNHTVSYTVPANTGAARQLTFSAWQRAAWMGNRTDIIRTQAAGAFTVSASVDGAGGSVSPTSVAVQNGKTQVFTATPSANYKVVSWSLSGGGTGAKLSTTGASNTTTLTMGNPGAEATVKVKFISTSPNLITPTAPYILHYDATTKTMQLGAWGSGSGGTTGGKATQANMMFAQFGSVVGFTNNNNTWATNGSQIMFNPTSKTNATMGAAFGTAIPNYSNYTGAKSATDGYISKTSYHTEANVKAGFGDICKLAGLTIEQVKAGVIDNKLYRLPTDAENQAYASGTQFVGNSGSSGYGLMIGSNKATFLPAAGDRDGITGGAPMSVYTHGDYWSSMPSSNTGGYRMIFSTGVDMNSTNDARDGNAVRCVRQ